MSLQRSSGRVEEEASAGNIALWLVILGATLLFIFLFVLSRAMRRDIVRLQNEVIPLETAVADQSATPGAPSFEQDLVILTEQLAQIEQLSPTLDAQQINWPLAVQAIRRLNPNEVRIETISQQPGQLSLQGRAINEAAVNAYAAQLESSGAFSRVIVQTILIDDEPFATVPPTPTQPSPTPTATNMPTLTPSITPIPPTPTDDLRDAFEWDDHSAMQAFVGASQERNFFPNFDVDNAYFIAKAGRTYRIATEFLAAGVDTFLTVTIGDQTLTNDDAGLGTLASEIFVVAPPDQDVNVFIRISNRGAFGPDKTYDLFVEEIVPTAVPTQPTPTQGPTLTATPDLRDAFEPDDPPALLAVNESQLHNFYPSVDVDHLQILVKERRSYQIVTSSLAAGVDTVVAIDLDRILFENDDFAPPGFSDLASSVCFSARKDTVALIHIRNKGQQFGPDKTYVVSAFEQPFYIDQQEVDLGSVVAGSTVLSVPLQMTNETGLAWTADTDSAWLQIDIASGSTTEVLTVFADTTALSPGEYEGKITITWEGICDQIIPVKLVVEASTVHRSPGERPLRAVFKPRRQAQNGVEFIIILELGSS